MAIQTSGTDKKKPATPAVTAQLPQPARPRDTASAPSAIGIRRADIQSFVPTSQPAPLKDPNGASTVSLSRPLVTTIARIGGAFGPNGGGVQQVARDAGRETVSRLNQLSGGIRDTFNTVMYNPAASGAADAIGAFGSGVKEGFTGSSSVAPVPGSRPAAVPMASSMAEAKAKAAAAPVTGLRTNPEDVSAGPPTAAQQWAARIGPNGEPVFDASSLKKMQAAGGSDRFSLVDGGIEAARARGVAAALAETGKSYADLAQARQLTRKFSMPSSPAPNGGYRLGMEPTRVKAPGQSELEAGIRAIGGRSGRTARAATAELYRALGAAKQGAAAQDQAGQVEAARLAQTGQLTRGQQSLDAARIDAGIQQALIGADAGLQQTLIRSNQPQAITMEDGSLAFASPTGELTRVMADGVPVRPQQQADPRMALELQKLELARQNAVARDAMTALSGDLRMQNATPEQRAQFTQEALAAAQALRGGGGGPPAAQGAKPSLAEFLEQARAANPGAPDDALTAFYRQKYGN